MKGTTLSLIIVEDDPWIRDGLKQMINWDKLGFELAGEATNGEEAMLLCRAVRPDAALVDISMPVMDGLAFIKEIKQELPLLKTVIMTCHDEFRFAKEAIGLGCQHYLLKNTSDTEKIEEIIIDLRDLIMEERSRLEARQLLDALQPQSSHELRDEWFSHLAEKRLSKPYKKLLAFSERIKTESFLPMLVHIHDDDDRDNGLKSAKEGLMSELGEQHGEAFIYRSRLYIYVPMEHTKSFTYEAYTAAQQAASIRKQLLRLESPPFLLLVQAIFKGETEFYKHFERFERQLEQSFYVVENTIGLWYNAPPYCDRPEELSAGLQKLDFGQLSEAALDRVLSSPFPPDLMKQQLLKLADTGSAEQLELRWRLEKAETWRAAKKAFLAAIAEREVSRPAQVRPEIAIALAYIEQHYSDGRFGLKELSEQTELTANYFSSLFKRELGVNVTEYINQYRIEMAKKLSKTDHTLKGYEVAERVGFQDPQYFSKLFKQKEGMSFKKYQLMGVQTRLHNTDARK
ncbi:response regulator [Paenibacillus agaridevorans]|uniref:response regulator n=1 Tax=Paenibacillus agaridevorans TaxID=171404 RepID=UPI001BE4D088|nr:response regulator [Paenibacillus agaridevorans]